MAIPTPHIGCSEQGVIAETVLLPGDPLRAKFIADTFLEDVVQFNTVRNMFGYTGTYKGKKISVMGSGMGIPSIGIYSYELIHFYGVKNLIRIGSCGSIREDVKIRDVIIGMGACTNSNYAAQYELPGTYAPIASWDLLNKAVNVANEKGIEVNTSSHRYGLKDSQPSRDILKLYKELGGKIITIGSDSHKIEHLGAYINEAKELLKELGFEYYCTFEKMEPIYHKL